VRWALLVVLLGACIPSPDLAVSVARVVRVIDGDSLEVELDGTIIELRLRGVNAPERHECLGGAASARLADLTSGQPLTVVTEGEDRFGRSLGEVFVAGESVAATMVAEGLAITISGDGDSQSFRLQEDAAAAGLGIWSELACGATGPRTRIDIVAMDANPAGADEDNLSKETVTIANSEPVSVDLSGWTLRDESTANRFTIPAGTAIESGANLTISSGCEASAGVIAWCADGPVWNNGGDSAFLLDTAGRIVSFYRHRP